MKPVDLFEFVENNQDEINALTSEFGEFLRQRQPNPYTVLSSLSDIVSFIIENNFIGVDDAKHLRVLTNQTLEAYNNTILSAAEEIMYAWSF